MNIKSKKNKFQYVFVNSTQVVDKWKSISGVGVIIAIAAFIYTAKQLKEMKLQRKLDRDSIVLQHSMECANSFQLIIDEYINFVVSCLINTDFNSAINQISYSDIKIFDKKEFDLLSSNSKSIGKYYDYFDNDDHIISNIKNIASCYLTRTDIEFDEYNKIQLLNYCDWELDEKELDVLKDINNPNYQNVLNKGRNLTYYKTMLISYFHSNVSTLLNKLESFALHLNSNLADEEILYPSLHQTYLKVIKYLYPHICYLNSKNIADKYFTNIVELYNNWRDRYLEELHNEITSDEKARTKKLNYKKNTKF